jgi:hypothetical protein
MVRREGRHKKSSSDSLEEPRGRAGWDGATTHDKQQQQKKRWGRGGGVDVGERG